MRVINHKVIKRGKFEGKSEDLNFYVLVVGSILSGFLHDQVVNRWITDIIYSEDSENRMKKVNPSSRVNAEMPRRRYVCSMVPVSDGLGDESLELHSRIFVLQRS
jgi:hypothetical protein